MPMPVIAEYQAKEGHEEQVAGLLAGHWALLHEEGFTTDQPAFLMRSPDDSGLFVEVFEWQSEDGPDEAWQNLRIAELWEQIQALCEDEIDPDYYEAVISLPAGGG